ncbi:pyrroline-5-carboxylate reductase [Kaarinaea lacus]
MNILFIGGGNMASSLIGGLIADGFDSNKISVVEINSEKRERLAQTFGVQAFPALESAIDHQDVVVFCVKPQQFKEVAVAGGKLLKTDSLVLSIAAGIRTADIATWLGGDRAIVRAMSNTPALVQTGASALYANPNVSDDQRNNAESLLRAAGIVEWVEDESLMDVVTALSGSGPAYFFRIMEGLINGAEKLGLSKDVAHLLTLQTMLGAAKMALESQEDIATLREQVTSPGGTTEQGLAVMNDNDIDGLLLKILTAARERATQLADQLGES